MTIAAIEQLRFVGFLLALATPFFLYSLFAKKRVVIRYAVGLLLSLLLMYLFIAVPLHLFNQSLDDAVSALDFNKDGFWSDDEQAKWTAEDVKIVDTWTGDGGRNVFGYLLSPLFSLAYAIACFGVLHFAFWLTAKLHRTKL